MVAPADAMRGSRHTGHAAVGRAGCGRYAGAVRALRPCGGGADRQRSTTPAPVSAGAGVSALAGSGRWGGNRPLRVGAQAPLAGVRGPAAQGGAKGVTA